MTLAALSRRDRRALVLGALVILGSVGAFRGAPAWSSWRAGALGSAAEARALLAGDRALAEALPATLHDLEARLGTLREVRPLLLIGRDPMDAAAALSDYVAEAGRVAYLEMQSIETGFDETESDLPRRVSVRARATGDIHGLALLLEQLEGPPHLLAVRSLVVRPRDVESPRDRPEELDIRFTVEGLALAGSPRGTEPR